MAVPRRGWFAGCTVVWLMQAGLPTPVTAGEDGIPKDFRLRAINRPGLGGTNPWDVVITAKGTVYLRRGGHDDKTSSISQADLVDLLTKVRRADFFNLRRRYDSDVYDNPTLALEVTIDG